MSEIHESTACGEGPKSQVSLPRGDPPAGGATSPPSHRAHATRCAPPHACTAPPDPSLCHASTQHPRPLYKRVLGASKPRARPPAVGIGPRTGFEFGLQGSPLTLVDVVPGLFRARIFRCTRALGWNLRRSESEAYRPRPRNNWFGGLENFCTFACSLFLLRLKFIYSSLQHLTTPRYRGVGGWGSVGGGQGGSRRKTEDFFWRATVVFSADPARALTAKRHLQPPPRPARALLMVDASGLYPKAAPIVL